MYTKIDTLIYYEATPFFPFIDELEKDPSVKTFKEEKDFFIGKLTELLSSRNRLTKPATRLLKILIDDLLYYEELLKPIKVNVYELANKAGYKNISSVYSAIGDLCTANILAMSNHVGEKGTMSFYVNPQIFGKHKVVVGDIVELAS